MKWFNYLGLISLIIIMIPNIVFAIKNKDGFVNKYHNKIVETIEQIGRFGSFIFMIINLPYVTLGYWLSNGETIYLIIIIILTLVYVLGWIIFWNENSLRKSLLLSIVPSLLFILCGIILLNIPLTILSVIFAPCHIIISCKNCE